MITKIGEELTKALKGFRMALDDYARCRKNNNVGEFLDEAGLSDSHWGVYGVSDWVLLESPFMVSQRAIEAQNLLESCKETLMSLVDEAARMDLADLKSKESNEKGGDKKESKFYELRFVIPKMVYAYQALSLDRGTMAQALKIQNDLLSCQSESDGSWPLVREMPGPGSPIATAMVLRALKDHQGECSEEIRKGMTFLERAHANLDSIQTLFVLNTILHLSGVPGINSALGQGYSGLRDLSKRETRRCVKGIYSELHKDVFFLANPVNVDFTDLRGPRFFRLPSDLVVLEALILLSGPSSLHLVHTRQGSKVLRKVFGILERNKFREDTSGHRASVGTFVFVGDILRLVQDRVSDTHWIPETLWGQIKGWFTYGRVLPIDLAILAMFGLATFGCWRLESRWAPFDYATGVFVGAVATLLVDIASRFSIQL